MKTLTENVYMAKLAVLISAPRKLMIHCPASARGESVCIALCGEVELATGWEVWKDAEHGLDLSDKRTPRSRASCSKVIGMKDPTPQMTNTLQHAVSDVR